MSLTEKEFQEIEARAQLASPGPWKADDDDMGNHVWGPRIGDGQMIAEVRGWGYLRSILKLSEDVAVKQQVADQRFIAASRFDVPALVEEVRSLNADRKELSEINQDLGVKLFAAATEVDNLRKMLEDANQREQVQIEALQRYQLAVRKVDGCCGCLKYEPFADLPRGTPGPLCENCTEREAAICGCVPEKPAITPKPDPLEDIMPPVEGTGGCC